jgi:phosphoribosyl-dephospho-CoA transferase
MLRTRTLQLPGLKTSVALERVFWQTIDALSEGEWQDWVIKQLEHKPNDVGRAMYLRIKAHTAQAVLANKSEEKHG